MSSALSASSQHPIEEDPNVSGLQSVVSICKYATASDVPIRGTAVEAFDGPLSGQVVVNPLQCDRLALIDALDAIERPAFDIVDGHFSLGLAVESFSCISASFAYTRGEKSIATTNMMTLATTKIVAFSDIAPPEWWCRPQGKIPSLRPPAFAYAKLPKRRKAGSRNSPSSRTASNRPSGLDLLTHT